jgi:hypothetical protein
MHMASHCLEKNAGLKMQEEGLIALIPKMRGREVNQTFQASSLAMDAICLFGAVVWTLQCEFALRQLREKCWRKYRKRD